MEDDIKFDLVQMIGSKLDILDQEIIYMNISSNQDHSNVKLILQDGKEIINNYEIYCIIINFVICNFENIKLYGFDENDQLNSHFESDEIIFLWRNFRYWLIADEDVISFRYFFIDNHIHLVKEYDYPILILKKI